MQLLHLLQHVGYINRSMQVRTGQRKARQAHFTFFWSFKEDVAAERQVTTPHSTNMQFNWVFPDIYILCWPHFLCRGPDQLIHKFVLQIWQTWRISYWSHTAHSLACVFFRLLVHHAKIFSSLGTQKRIVLKWAQGREQGYTVIASLLRHLSTLALERPNLWKHNPVRIAHEQTSSSLFFCSWQNLFLGMLQLSFGTRPCKFHTLNPTSNDPLCLRENNNAT